MSFYDDYSNPDGPDAYVSIAIGNDEERKLIIELLANHFVSDDYGTLHDRFSEYGEFWNITGFMLDCRGFIAEVIINGFTVYECNWGDYRLGMENIHR